MLIARPLKAILINQAMKKPILILLCITFICTLSMGQNNSTAPKIISTIPAFGDCKVDTALTEITLRFDQDMGEGCSVVNTKNLPKITQKYHWTDKRTLSIPVKLFPNRLYYLAFNNSRHQHFTNTQGIPLNPDDLHFQTKAVSSVDLNGSSLELNKKACKELMEIFPRKYSYATLKGINWKTLMEQKRTELENAETPTEFALKLVKLLRNADDPHLGVELEGQRFETCNMRLVDNNFNTVALLPRLQEKKNSKNFAVLTGVIDSIGYLLLRDWNTDLDNLSLKNWGNSTDPDIPAFEVIKGLLIYQNLIIDVRDNGGGKEIYARKLASCFVTDSIPFGKVYNYNEKTGLFDKEILHKLYPYERKLKYSGNIYVLSGPNVMSNNESFILMMKQVPNAKIAGMKTYGSSGNPVPYVLSNGVTVYIPSWQAYTLEGKLIEGNGIQPDIERITTRKDFQDKDGLVDEVMNMIKKKN